MAQSGRYLLQDDSEASDSLNKEGKLPDVNMLTFNTSQHPKLSLIELKSSWRLGEHNFALRW